MPNRRPTPMPTPRMNTFADVMRAMSERGEQDSGDAPESQAIKEWQESKRKEVKPVVTPVQIDSKELEKIPNIRIPEAVAGSPFQRRGFAECITDEQPHLTKHKMYRIEELSESSDDFLIADDSGNPVMYPSAFFRSIEHGPFRTNDQVQVIETAGIVDTNNKKINTGYRGSSRYVEAIKDDLYLLNLDGGINAWFPGSHLQMQKRSRYLDPNPFKKGDMVRVIKSSRFNHLPIGSIFTIDKIMDDNVSIKETPGLKALHNQFVKYVPKEKKATKVNRLSLSDEIRKVVNGNCYSKLTPYDILRILRDKKIVGEDIKVTDIARLSRGMFAW